MISFEVNNLHLDGEVTSRWHALLRPVCDFRLRVDGTVIYSDVEFPVVEFAVAVGNWAVNAEADGPEFAYTSLESETERLISFTPHQDGDWIASSAEGLTSRPVPFAHLRAASLDFVRRTYWLTKSLADVRNWLNERERAILDRVLTDR